MKYRKKPVVIEAVQWTGHNKVEVYEFLSGDSSGDVMLEREHQRFVESEGGGPDGLWIKTLEGNMMASEGDYIIRGVSGEYYARKPDTFLATYEVAESEAMITRTYGLVSDENIDSAKYYDKPDLITGNCIDGSILVINSEGE